MADATSAVTPNVIPVWGLMPDERLQIIVQARKFIGEGRASDVSDQRGCAYISVFDRHGAPYTIGREQRILHLMSPDGATIILSETLDRILDALDAGLHLYK